MVGEKLYEKIDTCLELQRGQVIYRNREQENIGKIGKRRPNKKNGRMHTCNTKTNGDAIVKAVEMRGVNI